MTLLEVLLSIVLLSNCQSNNNPPAIMKSTETSQNRFPSVAGSFYPANQDELKQMLKTFFAKAPVLQSDGNVLAIISPHAGYVFSGEVAAAAFNQIDPEKAYKTVFIIGSSHRNSFPGASVYSIGNYITPLGTVQTDLETAQKIAGENKIMAYDPSFQNNEHSIEVQIPFLQYWLKNDYKIVPILLGTQDERICNKIATILKPWFTDENLFVISTDFSHYSTYNEAVKTDQQVADAIITNNPDIFLTTVENCIEKKVDNLATGCCSWPSVITLMYVTEEMPGISYKEVLYKNSGDSQYGDRDRVVGYFALSVSQQMQNTMMLNEAEKEELLKIARNTIHTYLTDGSIQDVNPKSLPEALRQHAGAFVTLKKSDKLRGCIGHFEADYPLYKIVQKMAIASATQDHRFDRVSANEMNQIDIEISVLTPMQKVSDVNKIRLGTDGIYIKKGSRSGTFLPQVATDTGWILEEFLGHCSRDKAGIGWDGWKDTDTEIFVYQALIFG
jgi:MEMO1 family protein